MVIYVVCCKIIMERETTMQRKIKRIDTNNIDINKINVRKIETIFILVIMLLSLNFFKGSYAAKSKLITKEEAENSKKILELESLNVENYGLYPKFNSNTTTYYLTIPKTLKKLNISCNANVEDATIKITGNKSLTKTENLIQISLSKEGYESRTYEIYASKKENNGPKLSSLSIENGEMTPVFNADRYYYTVNVNYSGEIKPLNIYAETADSDTTIEILGNTTDNLTEGDNNIITILLKNSEGTTIYQIEAIIQKNNIIEVNKSNNAINKISDTMDKAGELLKEDKISLIVASAIVIFIIIIMVSINIKKRKVKENRQKMKDRI